MIRINRQTDYAVRVILALAKRGRGARLASKTIQQEMLIPPALMMRVVAHLSKNKIINTFPGREGGLMLSRAASKITLKDIVEAFEGPVLLSQCMKPNGNDDCPFESDCPVRSKWDRVQAAMMRELAMIDFDVLSQEAEGIPSGA